MAKQPKQPEKPAEPDVISTKEHNFQVMLDRYLTWQTLSVNRAVANRDPMTLIDAAGAYEAMIRDPRTQAFIKKTFYEIPVTEPAATAEEETTPPAGD